MLRIASAEPFTRPADTTAYASGDLVANSTTAGSVTVPTLGINPAVTGGTAFVRRVKLKKSGTGVTNAAFRVHLYVSAPTPTNGDNGVWLTTESGWIGSFDVTIDKAFSDGAAGVGIPTTGTVMIVVNPTGRFPRIFALVEARGAYTPASGEIFTISAEVETVDPVPVPPYNG